MTSHRAEQSSLRRGAGLAAALLGVVLLAAGCGAGPPAAAATPAGVTTQNGGSPPSGGGLSGPPTRHMSGTYSGGYSAAFAQCMRANGLPSFPAASGNTAPLANRGVDTHAPAFQSALYGPCKSLAPAEWVSVSPLGPPPSERP